jgi:hypothetical protein
MLLQKLQKFIPVSPKKVGGNLPTSGLLCPVLRSFEVFIWRCLERFEVGSASFLLD